MTMCRVLNVARAGFYAWLHNPVSARDKDNQRLLMLIRDSYSLSGGVYGYRRVHGDLNEIGETCGKNRVGRIMQQNPAKRQNRGPGNSTGDGFKSWKSLMPNHQKLFFGTFLLNSN